MTLRVQPAALLAGVRARLSELLADQDQPDEFLSRFDQRANDLHGLLNSLYGQRDDYAQQFEAIVLAAAEAYRARNSVLKQVDRDHAANPGWFQQHTMLGGVCYVQRYADTLQGLREKISYFNELGLTYLHLMPLYKVPDGPNDGGYAVSSYREVDPALGTIDDLRTLAADLRENGIHLVLDLVFNHTASDHDWALRARAGDLDYQDYYFMFPDRKMPDAYERNLREVFPDEAPGSFTYFDDCDRWVWTTFHKYQWDLNYQNPVVFRRMLEEMLFLGNLGADVIRLDAVPFIWKKLGTGCENLPQAHTLVRAYNLLVQMAAPGIIFKSEAIVHPDNVLSYLGTGDWKGREAHISYNPLLMVELWEALATRHTQLLTYSMQTRFSLLPETCAWVNYVRSHDDIGWGFADEDAEAVGLHGYDHRQYLNKFFTGEIEGEFPTGYVFGFNPANLDMRIAGTAASLVGLERALEADDPQTIDRAIRRLLLIYSVVMSMGGIPLIYLGDEIGQLNDYSYKDDPSLASDSRWTHRGKADWSRYAKRHEASTIEYQIFQPMVQMISIRKQQPAFSATSQTTVFDTSSPHIFAYLKQVGQQRVLVVTNFSEDIQTTQVHQQIDWPAGKNLKNLFTGTDVPDDAELRLEPYEFQWLSV